MSSDSTIEDRLNVAWRSIARNNAGMNLADRSSSPQATIVSGPFTIDVYYGPSSSNDAPHRDTNFRCTLFVRGEQFETDMITRLENIPMSDNVDIVACALSVALQDSNLLRQIGLIPSRNQQSESEMPPIHGTAENTPQANQVVSKLVDIGLRKIILDVVLEDTDGWDVYDIASGKACVLEKRKFAHHRLQLGAIICALIQIIIPVFLIYRGSTRPEEDLTWDVYIARLLFCFYAIAFEGKSWGVDNGDRVSCLLCFLPEFRSSQLIAGMLVNKLSILVVDVAIVILMLRSYTSFDVTLNALALYFILEIDDDLVDDEDMNSIRNYQKGQLRAVESDCFFYTSRALVDTTEKVIPAQFFVTVAHLASSFAVFVLALGATWMICEPFVLGWTVDDMV